MRKGIADGEFRPVNPAHFVPSMVAMIVFYFSSAPMMQKIVGFNPADAASGSPSDALQCWISFPPHCSGPNATATQGARS